MAAFLAGLFSKGAASSAASSTASTARSTTSTNTTTTITHESKKDGIQLFNDFSDGAAGLAEKLNKAGEILNNSNNRTN